MKVKKLLLYIILGCATLTGTTACMDGDWDAPNTSTPPYGNNAITEGTVMTIAELKTQYQSAINGNQAKLFTEDKQLRVRVTGNDMGGNLYKQFAIQDATGNMIVGVNANSLYPYMAVGQELLINLKGLYVGGYGNQAQIGGLYNGSMGRMEPSVWESHVRLMGTPNVAAIDTIPFTTNLDINEYCGALVKLENVTFSEADGYELLADEKDVVNNNCVERSLKGMSGVVIRTSTYSKFANLVMPTGPVDIVGIATRYRNTWQIYLRTESDITIK